MKYFLLIILIISCGFAQANTQKKSGRAAKWNYIGANIGRGSPIEGKAVSFAGTFYEAHFDDLDAGLSYDQSFGSAVKISNYTIAFGKTFEKDEGPSLRAFVGAGISAIVLDEKAFDGVQSLVGMDICPPIKLTQICARFNVRFTDSEYYSKASQEFSLVLKRFSF